MPAYDVRGLLKKNPLVGIARAKTDADFRSRYMALHRKAMESGHLGRIPLQQAEERRLSGIADEAAQNVAALAPNLWMDPKYRQRQRRKYGTRKAKKMEQSRKASVPELLDKTLAYQPDPALRSRYSGTKRPSEKGRKTAKQIYQRQAEHQTGVRKKLQSEISKQQQIHNLFFGI